MSTAVRIILRTLLGAGCGAISGAALLGIPTYLSTESGFLGPESAWAPLAAMVGGVLGVLTGGLIGFVVAKFHTDKLMSSMVGGVVGSGILIWLLLSGADPFLDSEIVQPALAGIPIGAVIGVIVSITDQSQRQK